MTKKESADYPIFQYISKEELSSILLSFAEVTDLYTVFLDIEGRPVLSFGNKCEYCSEFSSILPDKNPCVNEHLKASEIAANYGESYCFSCSGNLFHIVYPILIKDVFFGSVLAGPFLMESPDSDIILDLTKRYEIPAETLVNLQSSIFNIPLIKPDKVNHISKFLYYLLNSLVHGSIELSVANKEKLLQQSKINESIQMFKTSGYREDEKYPIEKENLLMTKIRSGDTNGAKAALNDLLGFLFLQYGNNLEKMKPRVVELCSLLSRVTIEHGADSNRILKMNSKLIEEIINSRDIYSMCYTFQDNIDIFTDSIFYAANRSNKTIKKATEYIATHFTEEITLTELADYLQLNSSYLSILFKQVTGVTYKEYLNQIRIDEAKRLLTDTDYSILDIAYACGFSNQGYFTKVFKKVTGMTPKQYR